MLQFKKSSSYEVAFIQSGDEIFALTDTWPNFPPSVRLKANINVALVLLKRHVFIQRTDKCSIEICYDKSDFYETWGGKFISWQYAQGMSAELRGQWCFGAPGGKWNDCGIYGSVFHGFTPLFASAMATTLEFSFSLLACNGNTLLLAENRKHWWQSSLVTSTEDTLFYF